MSSMCISSCRCCVFRSVVHPVAILSAVFCVICSLLMFVSDAIGDHMVERYSSMGLVMALCVAKIVSFCFPHVVDVSALSICIVLRAFVVVISIARVYHHYYGFIIRFPIVLDFIFITFRLHLFLSSLSISRSAISASTLSNRVLFGLPPGLLPLTLISIHMFFTHSSSVFLITCQYIIPLLMTVVIGSVQTSFLNSSLTFRISM